MYRRRLSPYSQINELRESRGELIVLVIGTVVLGVILNILAAILYRSLSLDQSGLGRVVVLFFGTELVLLLVGMIVAALYGRRESSMAMLEIGIPYFREGQRIRVAYQHPHYPEYRPAMLGQRRFADACEPGNLAANQLCGEWQAALTTGVQLQNFLAPWHKALVNCMILETLHRYGQRSLGGEARFGWRQTPLATRQIKLDDIVGQLGDNVFVEALKCTAPQWKLLVPDGLQLQIEIQNAESIWALRHPWHGEIRLRCRRDYRTAAPDHKIARILGGGLQPKQKDTLRVLISQVEVKAASRWVFLPFGDAFHEWATGLLSFLEEEVDWGYFEQSLPDRMIMDLLWMIGDLPEGASLWQKMESIEAQLTSHVTATPADQAKNENS